MKHITIIFSLIICLGSQAQEFLDLNIRAREKRDSSLFGIKDVTVRCTNSEGKLIREIFTKSNGKVILDSLPTMKDYKIEFTKKGYATKFVRIRMNDLEKDKDYIGKLRLELDFSMFKDSTGMFKFLESEEMVEFKYSNVSQSFYFDRKKLANLKMKIKYISCNCAQNQFELFLKSKEIERRKMCPKFYE